LDPCLKEVTDSRKKPRIPTQVVVGGVLVSILCRLGSLNALAQTATSRLWKKWLHGPLASADTNARVMVQIDGKHFRQALRSLYTTRRHGKTLTPFWCGWYGLAVDGHESSASFHRHCPACLERDVETKRGVRKQYYHRIVVGTLLCGNTRMPLDMEPVRRGEDEVEAAKRLLVRLLKEYPGAFDMVVADGLYLRADFFKLAMSHSKGVMAVLKDERRDLCVDARSLLKEVQPIGYEEDGVRYQVWDMQGFRSWPQVGVPVRVVRSVERRRVTRQMTQQEEEQTAEWMWCTTVPAEELATRGIVQFGHGRWVIENEGGFNELVNEWNADHLYKHHPTAIENFWLLTMYAYNAFHAFIELNLKPEVRKRFTKRFLGLLMLCELLISILTDGDVSINLAT
jgi:hypothetical protein